jgi:membrane protein implicated in regulation of membrane protease activity
MPDWGWWVVGAFLLLGLEAMSLDLLFASMAVGAVAGAIAAALGAPVIAQSLVALGVALMTLFVLRPIGVRLLRTADQETNVHALRGSQALVMQRVDARGGRVKIGGEVWSARSNAPGAEFPAGTDVLVVEIDGATAVVDVVQQIDTPTEGDR